MIVRGLNAQHIPESVGTGVKIFPHSNSCPAHMHLRSIWAGFCPEGTQGKLVWRSRRNRWGNEDGGSGGLNRLRVMFTMYSSTNLFSVCLTGLRNTSTRGG